MTRSYLIEPMSPDTAAAAYLLAQAAMPALSKEEWRQFHDRRNAVEGRPAAFGEREAVVVARNAKGYVKGLCIYALRDHTTYGRLIDVPLFVVSSAADGEGVAEELINFLRGQCDRCICSGIRFWSIDQEAWTRRSAPDHIARSDHGLFLPALESAAGIIKALRAHCVTAAQAIDRLSR